MAIQVVAICIIILLLSVKLFKKIKRMDYYNILETTVLNNQEVPCIVAYLSSRPRLREDNLFMSISNSSINPCHPRDLREGKRRK